MTEDEAGQASSGGQEDPGSAPLPEAPAPGPPPAPAIADGVERPVDPRGIILNRIVCAIVAAAATLGQLIALLIVQQAAEMPRWALGLCLLGWLVVTGLLVWFVMAWPELHYRHQAYRVTPGRFEVRTGVCWRSSTSVPRSRIQHIDVSQGPIQRQLGLAKLVLHTAGTDNAQVELNGLAHETALRIRDHLVAGGPDDAV